MSTAKYISELLFDYECVVLPGFGGFITNKRSATINRVTHQFNPPYSQIFFNKHLTANDGLLINHIASSENESYEIVRNQLEVFIKSVQLRLETGERVLFENIGTLEFDENKNIQFEQLSEINYNTSSFGLNSLISPAIRRKTDEEKLRGLILTGSGRTKPQTDRKNRQQVETSRKGFVKSTVAIALFALFVFSLSWALVEREQVADYWQEQASLFPFLSSTQKYQPRSESKAFVTDNLVDEQVEVNSLSVDIAENNEAIIEEPFVEEISETETSKSTETVVEETTIPDKALEIEPKPEVIKEKLVVAPTKLYYVVAGSFSNEINASKLVATLRQKGYNAMIADTTKNGMYRVAYLGIENLALAKEQLNAIREEDNPEAWIFRK